MALDPEHVRLALAQWEDFPVGDKPRPIVLTTPSPRWIDSSVAELRRLKAFDVPAVPESELTPEQLDAARRYCQDVVTGEPRPLGRIVRAAMPYATDRGRRQLPARIMLPENRRWPFTALDPDVERLLTWRPPGLGEPVHGLTSSLAEDDRTLTFRFVGHPANVAAYPTAVATETATAVHVEPIEERLLPAGHAGRAVMANREVVVRLEAPFGDRVLICLGHGIGTSTVASPLAVLPYTATVVYDKEKALAVQRWCRGESDEPFGAGAVA